MFLYVFHNAAQLSARLAVTELLLFQHSFNETLCQPFKIRFGLVAPVSFFFSPSIPRSPLLSLLVSPLLSATVSRATEQPGDRSSERALSTVRPIHAGGFLVMDSYETFETIPPNIIKQNPFLCFLFFEYTSYRKYRHLPFHI